MSVIRTTHFINKKDGYCRSNKYVLCNSLKECKKMDLATYVTLDATEMARLIREKEMSSAELVALSLAQLEKVNPSLNGTTTLREQRVLEEARKGLYAQGSFAGVPTFLKDTQALAGEKLTSGSQLLQENRPHRSEEHTSELQSRGHLVCRLLL